MLTNEQVLEIFKVYLDEDQATEVVQTRHGAAVMLWDYTAKTWSDVECCPTPEDLFDNLMDSFVSYKKFKVWELHRRETPTRRNGNKSTSCSVNSYRSERKWRQHEIPTKTIVRSDHCSAFPVCLDLHRTAELHHLRLWPCQFTP